MANKLSNYPTSPAFRFTQQEPFQAKDIRATLRIALGDTGFGETPHDFDEASTKTYFIYKTKSSGRNGGEVKYYMYVDTTTAEKTVESFDEDLLYNEELPHVTKYLPLEILETLDPWYSKDYENLFRPLANETAEEAVVQQIKMLREAANSKNKMVELIRDLDEDQLLDKDFQRGVLSDDGNKWERHPFRLEQKDICEYISQMQKVCLHLALALDIMLKHDWRTSNITFESCCIESMDRLKAAFIEMWSDKSGKPVRYWYVEFKKGNRTFENKLLTRSRFGPPLLKDNPKLCTRLRCYGEENLENLKIELMRDYFMKEELTRIAAEYKMTVDELKAQFHLTTISRSTLHNWMLYLGFHREAYSKGCYTDIHNKPENIAANKEVSIF